VGIGCFWSEYKSDGSLEGTDGFAGFRERLFGAAKRKSGLPMLRAKWG